MNLPTNGTITDPLRRTV